MKCILVFDLDDTLYRELDFVHSGFRAVANYLKEIKKLDADLSYDFMVAEEKNGRGDIFNKLLSSHGLFSKGLTNKCINIYRSHTPYIHLSEEAKRCLDRFKRFSKYIVTDGNKNVQANKIKALGITPNFKQIFITYRYGRMHSKPSPYCFLKIAKLEKVDPTQIVYIGDNPNKDFVGIKPLGFKTIRVLTGAFKSLVKSPDYSADFQINTLDELDLKLLSKLFDNCI